MHPTISWSLRAAFVALLAWATTADAQIDVTVDPPTVQPGQPVALDLMIGVPGCYQVVTRSVTRSTGHVAVAVDVVDPPPGTLCFSAPPPFQFGRSELGSSAVGTYSVTVNGTFAGNALQAGTATFVVAGGAVGARSIPSTDWWALVPLALAVVGFGFALGLRDSQR